MEPFGRGTLGIETFLEPGPVVVAAIIPRPALAASGQSGTIRVEKDIEENPKPVFIWTDVTIKEITLPFNRLREFAE